MRAHDVHDRVGLADVGEEAVAEPLALVGARDETGDVVEVDRVVHDVRGPNGLDDFREPAIDDGQHGHVGLDRGERVVGGLGPGLGERVEQRGLTGVGQPDYADAGAHRNSCATPGRDARAAGPGRRAKVTSTVPSAAPARTSDG